MQRSACLKLQINDQPPALDSFADWDFAALDNSVTPAMSDKLTALALLRSQCINPSSWLTVMPFAPKIPVAAVQQLPFIGQILELDSGITIAAFNESSVKDALAGQVPASATNPDEWSVIIYNTPFNQLQSLLDANNVPIQIIAGQTTLKILRCTPIDIADLPMGDVVNPYVDAFDIVRSMLTNTVSFLDDSGFAPAEYVANGDYIEFVGDYTLLLTITPLT